MAKLLGIHVTQVVLTKPSVLWCCWLGGRKGIRPVENWVVGCWHGNLSVARCKFEYGPDYPIATHCLLLQEIQIVLVLPFWQLRLCCVDGSSGRHGSLHWWIHMWVVGKTAWSLVNTCHTSGLQKRVLHSVYKALYNFPVYCYVKLYKVVQSVARLQSVNSWKQQMTQSSRSCRKATWKCRREQCDTRHFDCRQMSLVSAAKWRRRQSRDVVAAYGPALDSLTGHLRL